MSVNRDKILKQIIPPINRYLSMKVPSQMITLWKLSPARANTFFKPMSIPLKWSRQVAGRALCITVTKWMPGWKSVYSDSMEELEEMLLEDILNHINCQPWAEMKWLMLNWRIGIFGMVMTMNRSLETVLRAQISICLTYWIRYKYHNV